MTAAPKALRPARVLVVDDDPAFRDSLQRLLPRLGYAPSVAESADAALASLDSRPPDVVLLDLMMPGVSGHLLLREIESRGAGIPVVVVSGVDAVEDVIQVLRHGAVDFVRKPARVEDLDAALARATSRRRRGPVPAARTGSALPLAARGRASTPPGTSPPGAAAGPSPAGGRAGGLSRMIRPAPAPAPAAAPHPRPARPEVRGPVQALIDQIRSGRTKLPAIDPTAVELQRLASRPVCGVEEVEELVARDPATAAAVLRIANSTRYRSARTLASIREACVRLGNAEVFAIAQEILVQDLFRMDSEPFQTVARGMWRNALITSRVAARIAEVLRFPAPAEVYAITLTHNLGELVLLRFVAELPDFAGSDEGFMERFAAESAQTHEGLGRALLRSWGLPARFVDIAGNHHRPPPSEVRTDDDIRRDIVSAAWEMAIRRGYEYLPGQVAQATGRASRDLHLAEESVAEVFEQAERWLGDP
ncbi:HDOD domain-containing protein [Myxococcota bacterium]|nr:HDOD domain-containing protein [Myxococcota bacterium]